MIAIISPSKDLNFKTQAPVDSFNLPRMMELTNVLIGELGKKTVKNLMKIMDISETLATQNQIRYQNFSDEFTSTNSKPALFAFSGEVYRGINAEALNETQIAYCEDHVRILSGLYGVLRPLDLMQPYRLEMGISLKVSRKKNLYHFWGDRITNLLNDDLIASQSNYLINLASKEYFDSINLKLLKVPVLNIHFREYKNDKLMFVSFTAKKARGLMVRYMALENCRTMDELKCFNLEGYHFEESLSKEADWFYVR